MMKMVQDSWLKIVKNMAAGEGVMVIEREEEW